MKHEIAPPAMLKLLNCIYEDGNLLQRLKLSRLPLHEWSIVKTLTEIVSQN